MAKGNFYIYVQCTCSASYITSYLYINFRGMVNACYLNAYFMLDWKHLEILDFFPIPRTYESFQNQGKPPFCKTFWYTRGVVYVPYPKYNKLQCTAKCACGKDEMLQRTVGHGNPALILQRPFTLWSSFMGQTVYLCSSIAIAHLVVHRTLKLIHLTYLPILWKRKN